MNECFFIYNLSNVGYLARCA